MLEKHVEGKLEAAGVDLEKLMAELPAYVEGGTASERAAQILETLTTFDDFVGFKAMMVDAKRQRSGQSLGADALMSQPSVSASQTAAIGQSLAAVNALELGGTPEGWTVVTDRKWFRVDRKADPGCPVDLFRANAVAIAVPPLDFAEMLGDPDKRARWDPHCTAGRLVREVNGPNDAVIHLVLKPPIVSQREVYARRVLCPDHPEKGAVTMVMLTTSDLLQEEVAEGSVRGVVRAGNLVVRPSKQVPGRSDVTMFMCAHARTRAKRARSSQLTPPYPSAWGWRRCACTAGKLNSASLVGYRIESCQ